MDDTDAADAEPGWVDRFVECTNRDLNMPRALAVAWEVARSPLADAVKRATLLQFDRVLGLGLAQWKGASQEIPAEVLEMVQQREEARSTRDYATADGLRDRIGAAGFEVEDLPDGPTLRQRERLG